VTATWPPPKTNVPSPPIERALLLPWEECEAIDDPQRKVFPRASTGGRSVVARGKFQCQAVAVLRSANRSASAGDLRDKIDFRLIGPANSTGLHKMLREAAWDPLWQVSSEDL